MRAYFKRSDSLYWYYCHNIGSLVLPAGGYTVFVYAPHL
ncbi:hypothetical protein Cpin_4426 [Chitinophaga pinensis DSM 2588]|uniref:Uncharacterized protein n=1 Tax=Chitinophaga pinensis (strain ATCC 43595 / DSM 2588 / LMG 13176 / NBRC 15968 / NCIMB 11800 / UQM 2034) TaxID=485918 RepID=A0A979G6W3_CHIPD|nr:hypothetical protein Cpin_4426 [Chitinophaga pinensis DSM 2588]